MYSWGDGSNGRLGHGNEETQMEPQLVAGVLCAMEVFTHDSLLSGF